MHLICQEVAHSHSLIKNGHLQFPDEFVYFSSSETGFLEDISLLAQLRVAFEIYFHVPLPDVNREARVQWDSEWIK